MNNEQSIQSRLDFIGIDGTTREALRELQPLIAGALPGILDRFYVHLMKYPEVAKLFPNEAVIRHAKEAQEGDVLQDPRHIVDGEEVWAAGRADDEEDDNGQKNADFVEPQDRAHQPEPMAVRHQTLRGRAVGIVSKVGHVPPCWIRSE